MSRYFDDELIHSGVKGMKWKRHKYKLVKDANGKLHYIYDLTNKNKNNDQNTNHEIRSRKDIKPLDRFVATGAYDPNAHYEYTKEEQAFLDKERAEKIDKASKMVRYSGKYGPILQVYDQMKEGQKESKQREQQNREHSARSSEAANRAKAARKKQVRDKEQSARTSESLARANAAKEKQAAAVAKEESRNKRQAQAEANKAQIERRKRKRQAEANKAQIERRKRIRQAEANKAQIERRKRIRQAEANKAQVDSRKSERQAAAESKAQMSRQARAEEKDKVVGRMSKEYLADKRANTGARPLTETVYTPTKTRTTKDGYRVSVVRSTVRTGRSGEEKQKQEKIEDSTRKELNRVAAKVSNRSAKASGSRSSWADQRVKYNESIETSGQRTARAAESTARHKAAVKAQKKKNFTDTIDKGRKAVEDFFTPKKKKKR